MTKVTHQFTKCYLKLGLPRCQSGKQKSSCQWRRCKRRRFDPWVRKIPWSRKCNLLQYSCLENSKDRGAWQAAVHRVSNERSCSLGSWGWRKVTWEDDLQWLAWLTVQAGYRAPAPDLRPHLEGVGWVFPGEAVAPFTETFLQFIFSFPFLKSLWRCPFLMKSHCI